MANVESKGRPFYIAPWFAEGVTKAPVMTREEEKAWVEKFEADFKTLQRNREKLDVETLRTKYAKGYNRLTADLKAGVDTLLDWHVQTFVVNGLPTHPLDREGLEQYVKRTNAIIREETAPGRLLEQAKAALIDGLDEEKCWELVWRIYDRIEREAFCPYWMRHCFRRNGYVYNDIIDKWWRPVQKDGSERWTNEDGTLYEVWHNGRRFHTFNFPPKEAAPWENAALAEMPRCKGCGAPILWHKTAAGKFMPCDPDPVDYWERKGADGKVLTAWTGYSERGRLVSCDFAGTPGTESGAGYVPHWATCPNWRDFKKN